MARPQSGYYADLFEEAAALFESLAQNHPFVDGNKRTAVTARSCFFYVERLQADISRSGNLPMADEAV